MSRNLRNSARRSLGLEAGIRAGTFGTVFPVPAFFAHVCSSFRMFAAEVALRRGGIARGRCCARALFQSARVSVQFASLRIEASSEEFRVAVL